MASTLDGLSAELTRLRGRQAALAAGAADRLGALEDALAAGGGGAAAAARALADGFATDVKPVVAALSRFSKAVDNVGAKGAADGGLGGVRLDRGGLDRAVATHLFRLGGLVVGRMFCEEAGVEVDEGSEVQPFVVLQGLVDGFREGRLGGCVEWAASVREKEEAEAAAAAEAAATEAALAAAREVAAEMEAEAAAAGGNGAEGKPDVVMGETGEAGEAGAGRGSSSGGGSGSGSGSGNPSGGVGDGDGDGDGDAGGDGGGGRRTGMDVERAAGTGEDDAVETARMDEDGGRGEADDVVVPMGTASSSDSASEDDSSESDTGQARFTRKDPDCADAMQQERDDDADGGAGDDGDAAGTATLPSARLEFALRSLHYLDLLQAGKRLDALSYARAQLPAFARAGFLADVQALMACLLYAPRLADSPYAELVARNRRTGVERMLVAEYCRVAGVAPESPLLALVRCGTAALPVLAKAARVSPGWREQGVHDALPVEIAVDRDCRHHSVFTCPVSREEATEENGPQILPCGHVLSRESIQRLPRANNPRFKCPYCPMEQLPTECEPIVF